MSNRLPLTQAERLRRLSLFLGILTSLVFLGGVWWLGIVGMKASIIVAWAITVLFLLCFTAAATNALKEHRQAIINGTASDV